MKVWIEFEAKEDGERFWASGPTFEGLIAGLKSSEYADKTWTIRTMGRE